MLVADKILEHWSPSSRSTGPDLRDMTLKYGFNSLLNKMTRVPNLLVIYTYVKHTWIEVTYLDLLKALTLRSQDYYLIWVLNYQ